MAKKSILDLIHEYGMARWHKGWESAQASCAEGERDIETRCARRGKAADRKSERLITEICRRMVGS